MPFLAPPTVVGTDTEFTFTPPIFLPSIFLPLEAKWGQARNSEPVEIRSSDRRYRNRSDIGGRIDAPGDGRAPGTIASSNALEQPPPSFPTPFFCHPFFCHEPEWGQARSSEWTFARRICVIETGPTSVVGLMRPGTGALPPRLLAPTRRGNHPHLSPPHFSALHFSAIHFPTKVHSNQ